MQLYKKLLPILILLIGNNFHVLSKGQHTEIPLDKIIDFNVFLSSTYIQSNQFVDMMTPYQNDNKIKTQLPTLIQEGTQNLTYIQENNIIELDKNDTISIKSIIGNLINIRILLNSNRGNEEQLISKYENYIELIRSKESSTDKEIMIQLLRLQLNNEFAISFEIAYKTLGIKTAFKNHNWLSIQLNKIEPRAKGTKQLVFTYISNCLLDHLLGLTQRIEDKCNMRRIKIEINSLNIINEIISKTEVMNANKTLLTNIEVEQLIDKFNNLSGNLNTENFDNAEFQSEINSINKGSNSSILTTIYIKELCLIYTNQLKGITGASDIQFEY